MDCGLCDDAPIYGRAMRTELPAEHLRRRLGVLPDGDIHTGAQLTAHADAGVDADVDAEEADGDPNSLLPRWIPEISSHSGWLNKIRADPGRAGAISLVAVGVIAVLITVFTVIRNQPAPVVSAKLPAVEKVSAVKPSSSLGSQANPTTDSAQPVVVSVVGLVHTPGLVTLTSGARIADAVQAAGGLMNGADAISLNMARQVADGEQIVVGRAPMTGQLTLHGSSVIPGSDNAVKPGPVSAPAPPNTVGSQRIDLNRATIQQLDTLPGVGPVMAAAIVAWREAHGRFSSVDQLTHVEGIGPARLEKLRALVHV